LCAQRLGSTTAAVESTFTIVAQIQKMLGSTTTPENELRALVIERLLSTGHAGGDAVLTSEMVVDNWKRRADLVLSNGRLWGFELKSDRDSLTRLSGQVHSFTRHVEKLIVVAAEGFESRVPDLLSNGVGLWIVTSNGALVERVRPKTRQLSKAAAMSHLSVADLRRILSVSDYSPPASALRADLLRMARALPAEVLSDAARQAIKRRYISRYRAFLWRREIEGTAAALSTFRRVSHASSAEAVPPASPSLPEVPLGHPMAVRVPAGIVLRRLRTR